MSRTVLDPIFTGLSANLDRLGAGGGGAFVTEDIVKTRLKERLFSGVRLAKVLKPRSFDRTFCPSFR